MWRRAVLTLLSAALVAAGCGPICLGKTPAEDGDCTTTGMAVVSGTSAMTVMISEIAASWVEASGFLVSFDNNAFHLQISSTLPVDGATYALPAVGVVVDAGLVSLQPTYSYTPLSLVNGAITAQTEGAVGLNVTGNLTLTGADGGTYSVTLTAEQLCNGTTCR